MWNGWTKAPPLPSGMTIREFGNSVDKTSRPGNCEELLTETEKLMVSTLGEGKEFLPGMIVQTHMMQISHAIHLKYGEMLLKASRDFCKNFGRTWVFLRLRKSNWISETEPLKVEAMFFDNSWSFEPNVQPLEKLYEMDVENQYMLSFEISEPNPLQILAFFSCIFSSGAAEGDLPPAYERELEFSLEKQLFRKGAEKWICNSCYGAKSASKLKKCSKCLYARYCSTSCQRNDWTHHKTTCTILGKLRVQEDNRKK
jgi:hypothetical protein